jgi:hypothetical protein
MEWLVIWDGGVIEGQGVKRRKEEKRGCECETDNPTIDTCVNDSSADSYSLSL